MVKYKKNPEMETSWRGGEYKHGEDLDDLYQPIDRRERPIFEERPPEEERESRVIVKKQRQATPRMEEQALTTLKLMGPEVIGSLFDRVKFLSERIKELTDAISVRESLHNEMISEIDKDIKEKEQVASRLTDIDERRNFQLDISILRKEKRHEAVQYWKDLVELRTELREHSEKFQAENKILEIFKEMGGGEAE